MSEEQGILQASCTSSVSFFLLLSEIHLLGCSNFISTYFDLNTRVEQVIMMLFVSLLVAVALSLPEAEGGVNSFCGGNGKMLKQFNGRKIDTEMPCKYHAVRQICGSYEINLTPGNIYLHPKYRLDSLWLGIKKVDGTSYWEGRTDNKISVKFINGWKSILFNKKGGDLKTKDVLVFGKDSKSTWAEAKNGDFRVTFVPWDPDNKNFAMSTWQFECLKKDDFSPSGYSEQVCGGTELRETVERMETLGLKEREQVIYYDVFTHPGIVQTNSKCARATWLMTKVCTETQRTQAIITCSQILSKYKHTKCVTKYTCDPMNVFVDCIDWVCSGFENDDACERVGRGIDMCREFKDGNLTAKVKAENCFNDFLPIVDKKKSQ